MDYVKRKLSLPWSRFPVPPLPPQLIRRTKRNNSVIGTDALRKIKGLSEVTWVAEDFKAAPGTQEVSVQKGQQVEVLEVSPAASPEWCLVRLLADSSTNAQGQLPTEGWVPLVTLKPLPSLRLSVSKSSMDNDCQDVSNNAIDSSASLSTPSGISPANKRRSTFRKWLTNPVRKLSHGRLEKSVVDQTTKSSSKRPPTSNKWKLLNSHEEMGNKPATATSINARGNEEGVDEERTKKLSSKPPKTTSFDVNGEEEDICEVELPPPMQIQERAFPAVPSQDKSQNKLEQHSENSGDSFDQMDKPCQTCSNIHRISESCPDSFAIEELAQDLSPDECLSTSGEPLTKEEQIEQALTKRMFVMNELVETERDYVRDLGIIVEGYMEAMKDKDSEPAVPEDLKNGKDKMVFGNIEQIFEFHRDIFLGELEKCLEDPSKLGILFRKYDRKLHMYVVYCQNKPMSEYIVSEHVETYFEELRQKLGHKLQLPDMLIKPVQRIMKYQLMLRDIMKYTERAELHDECENLRKAVHVMHVVPKAANDMMNVGRLQGFEGKITAQGKLLLQDILGVTEGASAIGAKGKDAQVFLFEQIVIFSDIIGKKTQFSNPMYKYKAHIQVNKMALEEKADDGDPLKFVLKSKCPLQPGLAFVLQALSPDMHHIWVSEIRAILDTQLDFLRAIQSPIAYQKELTKEISAPELGSLWNPTLRKTLSHPPTPSSAKGGDPPDSVKQRRSAREKKAKSADGNADRRLTSACASSSGMASVGIPKLPSLPSSPTDKASSSEDAEGGATGEGKCGGEQRKHSLPLDKRSSPSAGSSSPSSAGLQSPPKSRKHFLEGFRNPLRSKSKVDSSVSSANRNSGSASSQEGGSPSMEAGRSESHSGETNSKCGGEPSPRRSSETNSHTKTQAAMDFQHAKSSYSGRETEFEFKKPWNLKFWRTNFRKEIKIMEDISTFDYSVFGENARRFISAPSNFDDWAPKVTVHEGDPAVLTCNLDVPSSNVHWTKGDAALVSNAEVSLRHEEGVASLTIKETRLEDSGVYLCQSVSECDQSSSFPFTLHVVGKPSSPSKPRIVDHCGTSLYLQWDPPLTSGNLPIDAYTVELFEQGTDVWQVVIAFCPNCSQMVNDLTPGKMYKFRVSANNEVGISDPGEPSVAVTISDLIEPRQSFELEETILFWKTGFEKDYSEVSELGRGRFASVKRCIQRRSGMEVAAKMLYKKRANMDLAQNEFLMMQSLQHPSLVRALDTYQTASTYILVHQLVLGKRLFEHLCERPRYTENDVRAFMRQLLDAVQYLHNCRICHLDLKPENILVDSTCISPQLKLIDFGDARLMLADNDLYVHPLIGSPEFSAPELVLGKPVSLLTDMWSIGVILYVFLSGVSPYLDDSVEETALNIVQNDYSFPQEYFAHISADARSLIVGLLITEKEKRLPAQKCWTVAFLREDGAREMQMATTRLASFVERRRHQNT